MKHAYSIKRQAVALTMTLLFITGMARGAEQSNAVQAYPEQNNEKVFPVYPAYALFAGGGLLLLSGIVTGSVALKLNSDLKDDCPGTACYEPHHDKVNRMDNLALVTDVFLPLSLVMIGSGTFLYLLSKKTNESYGDQSNAKRAAPSSLSRLSVSGSGVTWRF